MRAASGLQGKLLLAPLVMVLLLLVLSCLLLVCPVVRCCQHLGVTRVLAGGWPLGIRAP